jgi:hypothetical protein
MHCRQESRVSDNNVQHTIDVVRSGMSISLFPEFMRP